MKVESVLGLNPHGFHRVAYTHWGDAAMDWTVICVHALTRNGRDFDRLAAALAEDCRVACPDIVGRGRSDWLAHGTDYNYPRYLADMTVLIARLSRDSGVTPVDWVGTSMGGLIGMMLAAQPGTPIRRLVLNDVGPFLPKAALARIAGYIGQDPRFATLDELEAYLRRVHAPFGALSDESWRHMAEHSHRRLEDGGFALAYDPAIAQAFRQGALQDMDLWRVWDAVRCPVLILRGAESDLLTAEIAAEMTRRGPRAELVTVPGVGHAPALMDKEQITVVRDWLMTPR